MASMATKGLTTQSSQDGDAKFVWPNGAITLQQTHTQTHMHLPIDQFLHDKDTEAWS